MSNETRTADQIHADIKTLEQELVVLAGEPVMIWHGTYGTMSECPATGATLDVSWAIEDQSYQMWYPAAEGARAALAMLARTEDGELSSDGWTADLTRHGCHSSKAWITRLGA